MGREEMEPRGQTCAELANNWLWKPSKWQTSEVVPGFCFRPLGGWCCCFVRKGTQQKPYWEGRVMAVVSMLESL